MANIIPVHTMNRGAPNIVGAVEQGYQIGTQRRQQREAEADRSTIRNLAPEIQRGNPQAFSQAAAIDPQAATAQMNAGDSQYRRLKGMYDFIEQRRQSGDVRAVNAALAQAGPYIQQLTGKPAPTQWTEDMEPGWQALGAQLAQVGQGAGVSVQSRFVGDDGNVYTVMRDGQVVNTGVQADRQMWFRDQPGMDPGLVDKTGNFTPIGQGGQPQPQVQPIRPAGPQQQGPQIIPGDQIAGTTGQPVDLSGLQGLSPQMQQAAITQIEQAEGRPLTQQERAQIGGGQAQPQMAQAPQAAPQMPPQASGSDIYAQAPMGSGSLRRPSPAEEAAAVRRAQLQAEQDMAPQQIQSDVARQSALRQDAPSTAQTEADKKFAQDYAEFVSGGAADTAKSIQELRSTLNSLRTNEGVSGPVVGSIPMALRERLMPESANVQQQIEQVVQRNLRAVLGAQFTQQEGDRLIARAYNPALPQEINAERVERLIGQMENAYENKLAAAQYYEQNGTLRGFEGRLPSPEDFDPREDRRTDFGGQGIGGAMGGIMREAGSLGGQARGAADAVRGGQPPMEGAQQAPDGNWYVQQDGQWFRVEQ